MPPTNERPVQADTERPLLGPRCAQQLWAEPDPVPPSGGHSGRAVVSVGKGLQTERQIGTLAPVLAQRPVVEVARGLSSFRSPTASHAGRFKIAGPGGPRARGTHA